MKKANPAGAESAGLVNAQQGAVRNETNSTKQIRAEDFAAEYLARKFHLSPCVARVIAALAQLGARI